MKLIIHDLNEEEFSNILPEKHGEINVIGSAYEIHKCIGCFGCWVKNQGNCVIKDEYNGMGKLISKCEELIIISRCYYGGYSPFVKNVFDRSIAYLLPYFTIRKGEMHHEIRYKNRVKLTVKFYGEDITDEERKTANKMVTANGLNIDARKSSVDFYENINNMRGELLWV